MSHVVTIIGVIVGIVAGLVGIPAAIVQVREYLQHRVEAKKALQNRGDTKVVPNSSDVIRVEYKYSGDILDCIIKDFDNNKSLKYYLDRKDLIAFSFPAISLDVISIARDEWVKLSPYLVVRIIGIEPINSVVDYFVTNRGGASGLVDEFFGILAPYQDKICSAPHSRGVDYFTLEPGEREVFLLKLGLVAGYYYLFNVGVLYSYKGFQNVKWIEEDFVAASPKKARCWKLAYNHSYKIDMVSNFVPDLTFDLSYSEQEYWALDLINQDREFVQKNKYFTLPQ